MPTRLTTERLVLRTFREDDAAALFDLHSRVEVQRWIGDGQPMTDPAEASASLVRRREVRYPEPMGIWAIDLEDRFVGTRVLDHAREHELARVVAVTHPDNLPSQRVAGRLGMTDRGITERYYDTTTRLFDLDLTA